MSNILYELASWFSMQCDGNYEHMEGITIETLDNPGWSIKVSLDGTLLQDKSFVPIKRGDPDDVNDSEWIDCYKQDDFFIAYGGRAMLEEIIRIFIDWMKENSDASAWDDMVEQLKAKCYDLRNDVRNGIDRSTEIRFLGSQIWDIPQEHPEKVLLRKMFDEIYE